jgi:hypothetical protein
MYKETVIFRWRPTVSRIYSQQKRTKLCITGVVSLTEQAKTMTFEKSTFSGINTPGNYVHGGIFSYSCIFMFIHERLQHTQISSGHTATTVRV